MGHNKSNKKKQSKPIKSKIINKQTELDGRNEFGQSSTTIHSNAAKKSPWEKVNKSSKFDNIMNEQQIKPNQYNGLTMTDQELLEQQMILQAIEESNKLQSTQTQNEQNKSIINEIKESDEKEKNDKIISENVGC